MKMKDKNILLKKQNKYFKSNEVNRLVHRLIKRDKCLPLTSEIILVKKCFINCKQMNIVKCDPLRCASGCRFFIEYKPILRIEAKYR